jgi:hypothetical protein
MSGDIPLRPECGIGFGACLKNVIWLLPHFHFR